MAELLLGLYFLFGLYILDSITFYFCKCAIFFLRNNGWKGKWTITRKQNIEKWLGNPTISPNKTISMRGNYI